MTKMPVAYVRLMFADPEKGGDVISRVYRKTWNWPVDPQVGLRLTPPPRETGERLVLLVDRITIDLETDEVSVLCTPPVHVMQRPLAVMHDVARAPEPRVRDFDPAIMKEDAERWGQVLESCGFERVEESP